MRNIPIKKFLLLSVAVVLSTASCKKAYTCTCEITKKTSYVSYMSEWDTYASNMNGNEHDAIDDVTTTVTSFEKTKKANVQKVCTNEETTEVHTQQDGNDSDLDGNRTEVQYKATTVTTHKCTLEKQ